VALSARDDGQEHEGVVSVDEDVRYAVQAIREALSKKALEDPYFKWNQFSILTRTLKYILKEKVATYDREVLAKAEDIEGDLWVVLAEFLDEPGVRRDIVRLVALEWAKLWDEAEKKSKEVSADGRPAEES